MLLPILLLLWHLLCSWGLACWQLPLVSEAAHTYMDRCQPPARSAVMMAIHQQLENTITLGITLNAPLRCRTLLALQQGPETRAALGPIRTAGRRLDWALHPLCMQAAGAAMWCTIAW
jgi:hypothetical protein